MSIRLHTDQISVMGRATAGVRGALLDRGDEVIFAAQPTTGGQVLLISERGYAKRILFMDFEPQSRGGKGVKAFYFNKSGSNGAYVAGAAAVAAQPGDTLVTQRKSAPTVLPAGEVPLQGKQDKGRACVMAILDDVVTGVMPCPRRARRAGTRNSRLAGIQIGV
jgi:DNA gyrase/topoisomerase IV subunit A